MPAVLLYRFQCPQWCSDIKIYILSHISFHHATLALAHISIDLIGEKFSKSSKEVEKISSIFLLSVVFRDVSLFVGE